MFYSLTLCNNHTNIIFWALPLKYSYFMVQLNAHVSLTGLPVLKTLYKLILMPKKTKSPNCEFLYFLNICQFNQKSGFIGQKLN